MNRRTSLLTPLDDVPEASEEEDSEESSQQMATIRNNEELIKIQVKENNRFYIITDLEILLE